MYKDIFIIGLRSEETYLRVSRVDQDLMIPDILLGENNKEYLLREGDRAIIQKSWTN